jgi:predicted metal-dependent enzyme (double-stranded beta helix superfamily)
MGTRNDGFPAREGNMSEQRIEACAALLRQVRTIVDTDGTGSTALETIKGLLVGLANRGETLFPLGDFAMPAAHGRNHILALEDGDGMGLYLTIALPGKEAAPHDHGIWCVNAAISGREVHRFYRRTDDASRDGYARVEEIGEVTVAPGQGMAMADHAIHATEVIGTEPAIGLALYGYALARFPSVMWFHPAFSSVRAVPSRRTEAA